MLKVCVGMSYGLCILNATPISQQHTCANEILWQKET